VRSEPFLPCCQWHKLTHSTQQTKLVVTTSSFHAANWCRELLNSFVHNAAFPSFSLTNVNSQEIEATDDIRTKIIKRFTTLVALEEDLRFSSRHCQTFCPNGANVLKVDGDSDSDSDSHDSESSEEDEDGEMDTYANKADEKAALKAKKAAKKFKADKKKKDAKLKQQLHNKRKKDFDKIKKMRSDRALSCLRPLNHQVSE